MSLPDAYVPVAITRRSGFDESVHFGALVVLDTDGRVELSLGDPDVAIYPRSSNKPMQAVAMVRAGLRVAPDLLALVCASHDGTPAHLDAARRILASAGLDETALANTASYPLHEPSAHEVLRRGGGKTPLQMNCSGKHSGMVATCVLNGWPHDPSYLALHHPLQQAITATIEELAAERVPQIGIDGCGAPAHVMSLTGLARSFRAIATGDAGDAGDAVYAAMVAHPEMVGGEGRDVTSFMRHVSGLMAKDGADGVFAGALPDGRAIALKVADGGDRARPPLMLAALAHLGLATAELADSVAEHIMGHGQVVGEVRALLG